MSGLPKNKPEDIWKFIDQRGEDECWPWKSSIQGGYGSFRISGKYYKAHRVVFFVIYGTIELTAPKSNHDHGFVLHRCDNPVCCNPKHLFLGDINANMRDKVAKGRQSRSRGELHPSSVLMNADALRVREAALFGAKPRDLAEAYGVDVFNIYPIIRGCTYI